MNLVHAFIGVGSNLAEPERQVRDGLRALDAVEKTTLLGQSSCYRTAPMGPQAQPDYINAVAQIYTGLDPHTLLEQLLAIEARQGRVRSGKHWGPRVLDLDLLVYGNARIEDPRLTVPHPGIAERRFVLVPLMELAPDLHIPGLASVEEMLETCPTDRIDVLRGDS